MTKTNLFSLIVCFVLAVNFSCSTEDDGNEFQEHEKEEIVDDFFIESYTFWFNQPLGDGAIFNSDQLVTFKYDENNRIIKRYGGTTRASANSGFGGSFYDSIYIDLSYSENKIHLQEIISPSLGDYGGNPREETIIELDDRGRMVRKMNFNKGNTPEKDTTTYFYQDDKLVSFIKTSNWVHRSGKYELRNKEEANLYYSETDNLDSIVSIYSVKDKDYSYTALIKQTTKHFSGFDVAENPFRKLNIFKETFHRSLSKNNFTEYRETSREYYYRYSYYSTPTLGPVREDLYSKWTYAYDENGELIYDE